MRHLNGGFLFATKSVYLILALGFCKALYVTSIFHPFQPVDVSSLDRNSVSSLKFQALNAE